MNFPFNARKSLISSWFEAKGYSGSLTDMMTKYFQSVSGITSGTLFDHINATLTPTVPNGTLQDRLNYLFSQRTGISNRIDAEIAFWSNSLNSFQAFIPSDISGLQAWYKADSGILQDGAVQFTSSDKGWLKIATNSTLNVGNIDWEFGCWVYLDSKAVNKGIASKDGVKRAWNLIYDQSVDRFVINIYDGNTTAVAAVQATSLGSPSTSTWYFIRCGLDTSQNKAFIQVNNGTTNLSSVLSGTPAADSTADFELGANTVGSRYLDGRIDSAYFIKRLSTAAEVTALYNSGNGLIYNDVSVNAVLSTFYSNLISWWDLGEENGVRYDSKGTNNLSQNFGNIIDSTTLNGGFETAGAPFGSWTSTSGGTSTVNMDTVVFYSGAASCRFDVDASNNYAAVSQYLLKASHKYRTTARVRHNKGSSITSVQLDIGEASGVVITVAAIPTLTWTSFSYDFTAGSTSTTFSYTRPSSAGLNSCSFWVDDVTLVCTEIPANAGIASGSARDGNLCTSFNGTSQYLSRASTASLVTGDIDFTIWGWVNLNSKSSEQALVSKYNTASNAREWLVEYKDTTDRFRFAVTSDGSAGTLVTVDENTLGSPSVNGWYFFIAWHDSVNNQIGISINNNAGTTQSHTLGVFSSSTASFAIGAIDGGSLKLGGRGDGVGFIKRLLTASEKTALFNSGKGVKYAGLPSTISADSTTSFWNLDEYSSGTGAVTRNDSSANANNLTDTGNTPSGQGVDYYEGSIAKIIDYSGNNRHVVQTTIANRLLYKTNQLSSKPSINGDGLTKNASYSSDYIGTGNITIATIINPTSSGGGGNGRIIDNSQFVFAVSSRLYISSDATVTSCQSAVSSISYGTSYAIVITRTSAGVVNFYINGSLSGTSDQSSGTPASGSTIYLSNSSALTRGFDGNIYELFIFNSILSATDIAKMTRYLRIGWGI